MTERVPRTIREAFAQMLHITPSAAGRYVRQFCTPEQIRAFDEARSVEALLAQVEAWRTINTVDLVDASEAESPERFVKDLVAERAERSLAGRIGAHARWANVDDRSAATKKARDAFEKRFEREVDPEGVLPVAERRRRAEHAKKAYFLRMALKSSKARAKK